MVSRKMDPPFVGSTMAWRRRIELFIVMTTYNEGDSLFTRARQGATKNIACLCKHDHSNLKSWRKDSWKKVVIHIVSYSRRKINSQILNIIRSAFRLVKVTHISSHLHNAMPACFSRIHNYVIYVLVTHCWCIIRGPWVLRLSGRAGVRPIR